jgi:hypothetical protein
VLGAFFPERAGELNGLAEEAAGLDLGRRVGAAAVQAYRVAQP